jgi:acyl transferase domain-containing protein/3-hydroxymyristoyl/3-hydroxydecanoyl-(acyl carrier protein) dehydratase
MSTTAEPRIAIVGMGGLFPGARSLDEFWQNVVAGIDASREVPPGRWPFDAADVIAPGTAVADRVPHSRAYYLNEIPCESTELDIDAGLLSRLDPAFRLILAAGVQAFRDARTDSVNRQRVGVILGHIALPTESASALAVEILGPALLEKLGVRNDLPHVEPLNRYVAGLPAGVLAKALGLGGGCFTLDAACASSLYALKLAADELRAGRADLMLTGGAARPDCLYTQMGFAQLHALSPSGRCSPFDAAGDGLMVGEGCGVLALKRLDDALRDGDHIYATIAGIGLSNDVEGNLLAPSSEGQLRAMRAAYAQAGWTPSDVDLIECHATGTPVGDAVEFASLLQLWQGENWRSGQCVIGSVKSSVGHLLTGAGSAGLIKSLLALKHSTLPPTANFRAPSSRIDLRNSPFAVLQQARPWARRNVDKARRMAISGFGFGGINAHVLLEEYIRFERRKQASVHEPDQVEPIAVVGVDARFGPWKSLDAVRERIFGDLDATRKLPAWWGIEQNVEFPGYFIDEIEIPAGQFRIPPNELKEMLPQQLLALQVAAGALADAGNWEKQRTRTGVFFGLGLDLNTTNFHFRWWALEAARGWRRANPGNVDEKEFERWIKQLRDAVHPALNANRTMGALGSIAASRIARAFQFAGPSFTICSEESSGGSALSVAVRALQRGEIDLALTGAVDLAGDVRSVLAGMNRSEVVGEGAAAFVLKRLTDAERDGDRIYAVIRGVGMATGGEVDTPPAEVARLMALDRASANLGNRDEPEEAEAQRGAASRLAALRPPPDNRVVMHNLGDARAALGQCGAASFAASLLKACLSLHHETIATRESDPQFWLTNRCDRPRRTTVESTSVDGNCICVILEEHAQSGAPLPWPHALRPIEIPVQRPPRERGKLAFVYPGSGNHFTGMGQELAVRFPNVLRKQHQENERLRDQFAADVFWNGDSNEVGPIQAMFGQVSLGCFITDLLAEFGIKPDAAIGYSLGESAALFATRAWTARDEMYRRMAESSLFVNDLAGNFDAARRAWKLADKERVDWVTGLVPCRAEWIRAELGSMSRVYLLIVNTREECVIGGERKEVDQVLQRLGKQMIPLPAVTLAHCEVVREVTDKYRKLHLLPTNPPARIRYYSGAWGRSYDLNSDSAADSILAHATGTIDFPRLIETAYADGVRLFVEVGPGNSCSRMISQILGERPYFAASACGPRMDPIANLQALLTGLAEEGVDVDWSPLMQSKNAVVAPSGKMIRVEVGHGPIVVPPSPARRPDPVQPVVTPLPVEPSPFFAPLIASQQAIAEAQQSFLQFSEQGSQMLERMMGFSHTLLAQALASPEADQPVIAESPPVLGTDMCREFAVGSIVKVLGPEFAAVDSFPTRVRLPDGPLMLVDRIWKIEGEPRSLGSGRVVTDHLVHDQRWYVGEGHIPTSICVEAGQADLFLSGYLGIDFVTRGLAVYRLLDAVVTFHRALPRPGETIRYDIHIDRFFRQGKTHLFRFRFEGTVNGERLLSMRDGCAGFFTAEELAAGKGIVQTELQKRPLPGNRLDDWRDLATMSGIERYDDEQLNALRGGDLTACFGPQFANLPLQKPLTLPTGMLKLVDRVVELDPSGGRYGLGRIRAEMDIHPDDWFLTCHFVDDMVMPGTLMYECCLHTLRIFLMRMGWIGEKGQVAHEPVPGVPSQLKCRGQVTAATKLVTYDVSLKELGYRPEPYVICDALMYADGKPIVEITNMTLRLSGTTRKEIESIWNSASPNPTRNTLFDRDRITAFAIGKPSEAFGDRYRVFDQQRVIARLPGPPFQFLDRIVDIQNCQQWQHAAGGEIVAEYDVPPDEWYFAANRQPTLPFAVLLEIALQPCGWLAGYLGSALTSQEDLSFRNLGGRATQFVAVGPDAGTLTTRIKITRVSNSGGMIIQHYDFCVMNAGNKVYEGNTYFGFFTKSALSNQVGLREAILFQPPLAQLSAARSFAYPKDAPFPDNQLRMVDSIELFVPDGGNHGLGFIRGRKKVNPQEWFFKAHFFQDPVWPGSLGLEAFIQLLKVTVAERWGGSSQQTIGLGVPHEWVYRGQVIPSDREMMVEADITRWDDERRIVQANGYLSVDSRIIYQMKDFTLQGE